MALIIKRSQLPRSGKGLFTKKSIKKGKRIIQYRGEIINWKEYMERVERDEDGYLVYINKKCCIDAFPTKQYKARYANDASGLVRTMGLKNNCQYETVRDKCFIVATREIKPGEEILVSYGKGYWDVARYNLKIGRN